MLSLSVIICTHNPRRHYLEKVLDALKNQTLINTAWELLLVDNASEQFLSTEIDLSWHPLARCVREDKMGLTHARLRGIQEVQGNLLVFVDDDNVLSHDYLSEAVSLLAKYPFLGAFGGLIAAETEKPLEDWQKPFLAYLAIREITQPIWGNISFNGQNVPYGAGMCVRRIVAQHYAETICKDPVRIKLDRKGNTLSSAGDTDLALMAHDCGYATGLFPSLQMIHLIPNQRLEINYLLKLKREGGCSGYILEYIRNKVLPQEEKRLIPKLINLIRMLKLPSLERKLIKADREAKRLALTEIKNIQ